MKNKSSLLSINSNIIEVHHILLIPTSTTSIANTSSGICVINIGLLILMIIISHIPLSSISW